VKKSTSDLLIANCDEFIFYDDLVREEERARKARKKTPKTAAEPHAKTESKEPHDRSPEALDLVVGTVEALAKERGAEEKVWGSEVKQTIKRRNPGFDESYYGFKSFSKLLEEAQKRKLLVLDRDEKSGGYIVRVAAEA
jgi:hypothetical protein